MKIIKNKVVTFKYKILDAQNKLIEESIHPTVYLHGGYDDIFPKIEKELDNEVVGSEVAIQIEPEDAFGEYDVDLIKIELLDSLPVGTEVGMKFEEINKQDINKSIIYTVTDIESGKVVLDANHPLAGIAIRIFMQVIDIRDATELELSLKEARTEDSLNIDEEFSKGDYYKSLKL
tara:strand:- start:60 stop:587 length:528 start_codon:yes stop_codon:yes gene_type:complete